MYQRFPQSLSLRRPYSDLLQFAKTMRLTILLQTRERSWWTLSRTVVFIRFNDFVQREQLR